LGQLDDPAAHRAVRAERACLAELAAGCLAPVGAWARVEGDRLTLGAAVFEQRGTHVRRVSAGESGSAEAPEAVGLRVAAALRDAGAEEMLLRMRSGVS
jgi:hydroxymethylbilane synthase